MQVNVLVKEMRVIFFNGGISVSRLYKKYFC